MAKFTHQAGDTYHVTGKDMKGKRFKLVYSNPYIAMTINIYNGSVWQVRGNKRKLLKRVFN